MAPSTSLEKAPGLQSISLIAESQGVVSKASIEKQDFDWRHGVCGDVFANLIIMSDGGFRNGCRSAAWIVCEVVAESLEVLLFG